MALFSTAVDTCLYSFSIRRFLFRSTVAPLRCCQPKKLGASLAKLYSPKCLEVEFCEVRPPPVLCDSVSYVEDHKPIDVYIRNIIPFRIQIPRRRSCVL